MLFMKMGAGKFLSYVQIVKKFVLFALLAPEIGAQNIHVKFVLEGEQDLIVKLVFALRKGGSSDIENIQPLCRRCNVEKGIEIIDYRPSLSSSASP